MVTFKSINKTDNYLIYHYFPEGKEELDPGILQLNLSEISVKILKLAEKDFEQIIPKEELNELRNVINKARVEAGEPELTNDELPIATEDEILHFYADKAIQKILNEYKKGKILETGTVMWY